MTKRAKPRKVKRFVLTPRVLGKICSAYENYVCDNDPFCTESFSSFLHRKYGRYYREMAA